MPDPARLAQAAGAASRKGPPPVHLWNPPHCGDSDMRILADGTWHYRGTPIGRPEMVRLFASILRRDPEGFVLVTPVEKLAIAVDDAPFVAQDVRRQGDALMFLTNVGEEVAAGPDHPLRVEPGPRPYLRVRGGLDALVDRKTFYRLVEFGETRGGWFGVASRGAFFPVAPAAEAAP